MDNNLSPLALFYYFTLFSFLFFCFVYSSTIITPHYGTTVHKTTYIYKTRPLTVNISLKYIQLNKLPNRNTSRELLFSEYAKLKFDISNHLFLLITYLTIDFLNIMSYPYNSGLISR